MSSNVLKFSQATVPLTDSDRYKRALEAQQVRKLKELPERYNVFDLTQHHREALKPPPTEAEKQGMFSMPFVDLHTVVKTVKMLRNHPDRTLLDPYNRIREP